MSGFRPPPLTSHSTRPPRPPPCDPWFPFSNAQLKVKAWQDDLLAVKDLRSRTQLTRRKLEFIPLLRNLREPIDRISIVKSQNNEYNIYRRGNTPQHTNNYADVVNGHANGQMEEEKPMSSSWVGGRGSALSLKSGVATKIGSDYWGLHSLKIAGSSKCLSPSRQTRRTTPPHPPPPLPKK